MLKKKILISVVISAAALSFAVCKKEKEDNTKKQEQVFAVTTVKAEAGLIRAYLPLAGDIVPGSTVEAYSDAAGKVTRIYVSLGSRVSNGQPILLVDPSKPGMRYMEHIVRAPINGTVISLPAEVGMTVSQSTPLVRLSGGGALEIQLFVPERYISRVGQSMSCEITLDAYPGEVFRGVVREVSPTVDPVSRTMLIKINVDNPGSRLKSGMFAKVNIVTESKNNAIKVPSRSVVIRSGKKALFVVNADGGAEGGGSFTAKQIDIETGIESSDGTIEITSGVNAGDEVVDKGMTLLVDGAKVNIITRNSEANKINEVSEVDSK
ncbi:MAG: efflux RND transporter periplasmic adaptor subunit [Spirochaetaceae bacterium]|jgi:multidrug efflux pump subunit AcrA (membrane-fusion protein)|nr:efflux RND transporter periplasmic adaptor subunit [Spirochaetaceae bacterium]GMO24041.1 MAG: efflux RND transporter periplasmic adaptor subunit [Termitinemataceae bacterium]